MWRWLAPCGSGPRGGDRAAHPEQDIGEGGESMPLQYGHRCPGSGGCSARREERVRFLPIESIACPKDFVPANGMRNVQLRHTLTPLFFGLTLGLSSQTSSQEKVAAPPPADTVTVVLTGSTAPSGVKAKESWTRTTDSPTPAGVSSDRTPDSGPRPGLGITGPADPKNPPIRAILEPTIPVPAISETVSPAAPVERRVKYEVYSSGLCRHVICQAALTYRNASGGTEQVTVSLPWDLSFSAQIKQFVYLSARKTESAGTIECTIYLDGFPVKKATANSPFGIATVSGTVPLTEIP